MKTLWLKFKGTIIAVGLALAALLAIVATAFSRGKRAQQSTDIKEHGADEQKKIDDMAARGDADGLAADILRRAKEGK